MPNTVDDYSIFIDDDRGQRVLANMLLEGGFFNLNHTTEEMAVQNFLKVVLTKTGRFPVSDNTDNAFVDAVKWVGGLKNRSPLSFVKQLRRMSKSY